MKLLITGAHGQLGRELACMGDAHERLLLDHRALDITDATAVERTVADFAPDVVINAAAYTAVDRAESDRDGAFAVNRDGPANLARACAAHAAALIHVSTDYVFDGTKTTPYVEDDTVAPVGVYGESKLAGEDAVRRQCARHLIVRTSWVFSSHGNNFVKTMLRLGAEREQLGIVADQHGCPTAATELARGIYGMLDAGIEGRWGTYHFCQPEPTTWYAFARAIFDQAGSAGMKMAVRQVNPITTADYPTPARRPANSVMACSHFEQVFDYQIKPWWESLQEIVKELKYD